MKAFSKFIIVVILLLVLAFVFVWIFKTPLVSSYLSKKMGVGVSVEMVNVSSSEAMIKNLEMDNLPRYKSPKALTCGQIVLNYSVKGLRSSPTYVDLLTLQDMTIFLECNDPLCSTNNWETILSQMPRDSNKEYLIGKVEISNLRIDILGSGVKPNGVITTKIDHLEFTNVSSKEGIPLKQIITDIFIKANMQKYFKELINQPMKMIKDVLPGLKLGAAETPAIPEMPETPPIPAQIEDPVKNGDIPMDSKEKPMDEKSREKMKKQMEEKMKEKEGMMPKKDDMMGMEVQESSIEETLSVEVIVQEDTAKPEAYVEEIVQESFQTAALEEVESGKLEEAIVDSSLETLADLSSATSTEEDASTTETSVENSQE